MKCPCGKPLEECRCSPVQLRKFLDGDETLFTAAELGLDPEEDDAYISIHPVDRGWCEL